MFARYLTTCPVKGHNPLPFKKEKRGESAIKFKGFLVMQFKKGKCNLFDFEIISCKNVCRRSESVFVSVINTAITQEIIRSC